MAPKSGSMKRPAASVVTSRRSTKPPVHAPAKQVTGNPRAIIAALKGKNMEAIPRDVLALFKNLASQSLAAAKGKRQPEEARVAHLGEQLAAVEDDLLAALRKAQATVESADADKVARVEALSAAESDLADSKRALADMRLALKDSTHSCDSAHEAVKDAMTVRKTCEADLRAAVSKTGKLVAVEKDSYTPLTLAPGCGAAGHQKVKKLCKVGKEFGFHEVLLTTLPAVLRKQIDKRRTFDGIALEQVEIEFARCFERLEASVADARTALNERSTVVRAAQATFLTAVDQQKASGAALAESEAALAARKEALAAAQGHVRSFDKDARRNVRAASQAHARLMSFRRGPLTAFGELRTCIPSAVTTGLGPALKAPVSAITEAVSSAPVAAAGGESDTDVDMHPRASGSPMVFGSQLGEASVPVQAALVATTGMPAPLVEVALGMSVLEKKMSGVAMEADGSEMHREEAAVEEDETSFMAVSAMDAVAGEMQRSMSGAPLTDAVSNHSSVATLLMDD